MYRDWLVNNGTETEYPYKTASLKKRLQSFYESSTNFRVMIFLRKGESSILCSKDLSIGKLLATVAKHKLSDLECDHKEESEEDESRTNATDDELSIQSYHAAKSLRLDIKDNAKQERKGFKAFQSQTAEGENQIDVPPLEISYEYALEQIGVSLYNHVAWLITDASSETKSDGRVCLDSKQHE